MRFYRKDLADSKVFENVKNYMRRELPTYEVLKVVRKSDYRSDDYLYEVEAKNRTNDTYTVWTCWNESTQSLNHGHYDIETEKECEKIMGMFHIPKRFDVGDRVMVFLFCEENEGTINSIDSDDRNFYFVDFDNGDFARAGESELEFLES